jgi:hypothetical protein
VDLAYDWVLPFTGCTEYVPELNNLWFGILSTKHGSVFCASDLSSALESHNPPVLHAILDDTADRAPGEWDLVSSASPSREPVDPTKARRRPKRAARPSTRVYGPEWSA